MDEKQTETVTELLRRLQTLAVPRCESTADEIAYMACRDEIIHDALACVGGSTSTTDPLHFITVDEQALAQLVLARTFDTHKDLLRQQLKDAQVEAEKWKQIALAANSNAGVIFAGLSEASGEVPNCATTAFPARKLSDKSTQTDTDERSADSTKKHAQPPSSSSCLCSRMENGVLWGQLSLDQATVCMNQKLDALTEAIGGLSASARSRSSRSCKRGNASAHDPAQPKRGSGHTAKARGVPSSGQKTVSAQKQSVASHQLFERLALRNAPPIKPSELVTEPAPQKEDDHILYTIRAMPLENARRKKSDDTTLPVLRKK